MTGSQLRAYDLFLDENDWDIYYWATQQPSQTSLETAEGSGPDLATASARGKDAGDVHAEATASSGVADAETPEDGVKTAHIPDKYDAPTRPKEEWAQTWGTFKPQYRPVPARWKSSKILSMLRQHVLDRSAGGVLHDADGELSAAKVEGEGLARSVKGTGGGGLGSMPELRNFST